MAKRGQRLPFTVRFQFEGGREWAKGSYATREDADWHAEQQAKIIGPDGQVCRTWVVAR